MKKKMSSFLFLGFLFPSLAVQTGFHIVQSTSSTRTRLMTYNKMRMSVRIIQTHVTLESSKCKSKLISLLSLRCLSQSTSIILWKRKQGKKLGSMKWWWFRKKPIWKVANAKWLYSKHYHLSIKNKWTKLMCKNNELDWNRHFILSTEESLYVNYSV